MSDFVSKFHKGEFIGAYKLLEPVGKGGFGEVWKAEHTDLMDVRALKIPTDLTYVRQLRKEGRIQFTLDHPGIVKTLDLNTHHSPPYFVMEYVDGDNLRRRLEKGVLPAKQALEYVIKTLDVLEYAHSENVIHRDLKPENILIDKEGALKVTDFGLGKVQEAATRSIVYSGSMKTSEGDSISGTYDYMSPEQLEEPTLVDERTDLYALGIILFELLTGTCRSRNMVRDLKRRHISPRIIKIVDKATDELEYRYESAAEMKQAAVEALHAGENEAKIRKLRDEATKAEKQGDLESALKKWESLVKAAPDNTEFSDKVNELRKKLKVKQEQERKQEKEKRLRAAFDGTKKRSDALSAKGDDEKAMELWNGLMRKYPELKSRADREKEELNDRTGRQKRQKAQEQHQKIENLKNEADRLKNSGDHQSALNVWRRIAAMSPHDDHAEREIAALRRMIDGERGRPVKGRSIMKVAGIFTAVLIVIIGTAVYYFHGRDKKKEAFQAEYVVEKIDYEMVRIYPPPGDGIFMMGSPENENVRYSDEKQHNVKLTKSFYIGATEITQAQWKAIMGENPSYFKGNDLPVESITWFDAVKFCNGLSKADDFDPCYRISGDDVKWIPGKTGYRLPTEAEWEYACRAGSDTRFCFGDSDEQLYMYANYCDSNCNYDWRDEDHNDGYKNTAPPGSYKPNAWGLYDMHGNVWEWCWDWYGDYPSGTVTDPKGPDEGSTRVTRGGGWDDFARNCRSAPRRGHSPSNRGGHLGCRPVREIP